MIIRLLAALPILLAIVYTCWQWQNYRGWVLAKKRTQDAGTRLPAPPTIALLIPFRNEAANLPALLDDIAALRYAALEVLLIDDHSEDGGPELVAAAIARQEIHRQGPPLRLLTLADYLKGKPVVAYKKAALHYAIAQTTADVVLTTDADCRLPASLPADIARAVAAGADVVCGPVVMAEHPGLLSGFQALDFLAFQLYTASCVARQNPVLANGACFAFRRAHFLAVNGYTGMDHLPSGDDVLLLHKFAQRPGLRFDWHQGPPVTTHPVTSWRGLWRQRIRWAGKAGAYVSPALQFGQALAFLTALGILVALLLGFFDYRFWLAGVIAWGMKAIVDGWLLADICRHYDQEKQMRWYIFTQLLYPFYLVAVGGGALLGLKAGWKGRL